VAALLRRLLLRLQQFVHFLSDVVGCERLVSYKGGISSGDGRMELVGRSRGFFGIVRSRQGKQKRVAAGITSSRSWLAAADLHRPGSTMKK
jgi:hypothetical protein